MPDQDQNATVLPEPYQTFFEIRETLEYAAIPVFALTVFLTIGLIVLSFLQPEWNPRTAFWLLASGMGDLLAFVTACICMGVKSGIDEKVKDRVLRLEHEIMTIPDHPLQPVWKVWVGSPSRTWHEPNAD